MKRKWTEEELKNIETNFAKEFEAGKIRCPLHLSGGNEATLISLFTQIKDRDYVFSTHRSHYHYLLKGGDLKKLRAEIYGKNEGMCLGKGRSMHLYDPSIHFYTSAIIGGTPAIAVGVALGLKKKFKGQKRGPHVWCFVGDGTEDTGHFIEAARFANCRKLPLTFIVEDNDRAVESTKAERWHNYQPINAQNVLRYSYVPTYPHVGVGKWVTF